MCSVASLEWVWRIGEQPFRGSVRARLRYRTLKPLSAKKDKQNKGCLGKPLGCRLFGRIRDCSTDSVAIRERFYTWLFLKGNRCFGNNSADNRESLPDLSRKLYRIRCPIPIIPQPTKAPFNRTIRQLNQKLFNFNL